MLDRFHFPGNWAEVVEIDGPEAHHLSRVLRASPGDEIELFDGQGRSAHARIEVVRKQQVTARILTSIRETPPPACQLILAVAVPKGDRFSWLIEKATELGVDRLIPLSTSRGVVKPSEHKLQKGEQTVIAACKQSGRDQVMKLDEICPLTSLRDRVDQDSTSLLFGAVPEMQSATPAAAINYGFKSIVAVIGPEGGFTEPEIEIFQRWSATPICLCPNVLRIETAAIAFAAYLSAGRHLTEKTDR